MNNRQDIQHRKVQGYLKPKNHVLFEGYVKTNQVSESAAINMIVKDFFSRVPEKDRVEYMSKARSEKTY